MEGKLDYNGLPIYAQEGLHEHIGEYVNKNFGKNIKILILGSGSGALDKRLFDYGYKKITSVDINKKDYLYKNKMIDFISLDLNKNFSTIINKKFDLILSVEIIEHLFSPYNFLLEMQKLLIFKGNILITTPNIHSDKSRLNNLLFGFPRSFYGTPTGDAHISILTQGILEYFGKILNLELDNFWSILDEKKNFGIKTNLYSKIGNIIFTKNKVFDFLFERKIDILRKGDIAIYSFKYFK